jgi:hypothetical protein
VFRGVQKLGCSNRLSCWQCIRRRCRHVNQVYELVLQEWRCGPRKTGRVVWNDETVALSGNSLAVGLGDLAPLGDKVGRLPACEPLGRAERTMRNIQCPTSCGKESFFSISAKSRIGLTGC